MSYSQPEGLLPKQFRIEAQQSEQIHQKALICAQEYRAKEAGLVSVLQLVDEHFVYRAHGYNSLYEYAVKALRLSEHQAYDFTSVARKAKSLPAMQAALNSGELTVSKARRLSSVVNASNQEKWVTLAINSTQRELDKEIVKENPLAICKERTRYLTEDILEMQVPITEKTLKMLGRVKALLSKNAGQTVSTEEAIALLCSEYLKRNDPLEKAKRFRERQAKQEELKRETHAIVQSESRIKDLDEPQKVHVKVNDGRRAYQEGLESQKKGPYRSVIPKETLHKVYLRDKGQCQYLSSSTKSKCLSEAFVEIHHIQPLSYGGDHSLENLVTLCSGHHKAAHFKFGAHQIKS